MYPVDHEYFGYLNEPCLEYTDSESFTPLTPLTPYEPEEPAESTEEEPERVEEPEEVLVPAETE